MSDCEPSGLRLVRDPDLERVSALMEASWDEPRWVYDRELLEYHLRRPSIDRDLLLGLEDEHTGELVAYYALLPLVVELAGEPRRAVFGSFLSAARAWRNHGAARALQVRLLRLAIDKGHELYLAFCEVGATSCRSIARSCEALGLSTTTANSIGYLGFPLAAIRTQARTSSESIRAYRETDEQGLAALTEGGPRYLLHQRVERRDRGHRFAGSRTRTLVSDVNGDSTAFVTWLLLEVLDAGRRFRNAYLQELEISRLQGPARRDFFLDALQLVADEGCQLALAPTLKCFGIDFLTSVGFRRTARRLDLLATPLAPGISPLLRRIDDFCLDVF